VKPHKIFFSGTYRSQKKHFKELLMHTITLMRHGESDGNANGLIQGQIDLPLTEKGQDQAQTLAQAWLVEGRHFDQVIASPLMRARLTAEIIAEGLGLPVEYDPIWMERSFGTIDGQPYREIIQKDPPPDFFHPYNQPGETGESLVDLFNRAGRAIQSLVRRPSGAYLVVSHGAFLNMVMNGILGISPLTSSRGTRFVFSNTGFVDLTYDAEFSRWRVYRFWSSDEWFA
jgi:2,3-bisphosphoglycerate-dependent phosphoglycerate mutase